jgi:GNAT superfamily N-acetyltransferase
MDEYEIVPYSESYLDEVLRLRTEFSAVDADWNAAHFRWQQQENPSFEQHIIRLALFKGRAVGMRILQPAVWQAGDPAHRFRAPLFVGTFIDPAHRKRGLFERMTQAIESDLAALGIEWAFNSSPAPVTLVASMASGGRSIGSLGKVVREPSIRGDGLQHKLRRNLARVVRGWRAAPRGVQFSDAVRADEMAGLASGQVAGDARIRRERGAAYFDWRFRDPSSRYRFIYVDRDGAMVGFAVLQSAPPPSGDQTLRWVDWGVVENYAWKALAGVVVDYAERVQQDLVTWAATHPDEANRVLEELSFEPRKEPGLLARSRPTLVVRRVGSHDASEPWIVRDQSVDDLTCWDLRMTDSDMF